MTSESSCALAERVEAALGVVEQQPSPKRADIPLAHAILVRRTHRYPIDRWCFRLKRSSMARSPMLRSRNHTKRGA